MNSKLKDSTQLETSNWFKSHQKSLSYYIFMIALSEIHGSVQFCPNKWAVDYGHRPEFENPKIDAQSSNTMVFVHKWTSTEIFETSWTLETTDFGTTHRIIFILISDFHFNLVLNKINSSLRQLFFHIVNKCENTVYTRTNSSTLESFCSCNPNSMKVVIFDDPGTTLFGFIDIGNGRWTPLILVTSLRCWWPI